MINLLYIDVDACLDANVDPYARLKEANIEYEPVADAFIKLKQPMIIEELDKIVPDLFNKGILFIVAQG